MSIIPETLILSPKAAKALDAAEAVLRESLQSFILEDVAYATACLLVHRGEGERPYVSLGLTGFTSVGGHGETASEAFASAIADLRERESRPKKIEKAAEAVEAIKAAVAEGATLDEAIAGLNIAQAIF